MPGNLHYRIEQPCAAPQQVIYDVLLDVERWPDWMPGVRAATWERPGTTGTGVGGIRRFGMPGLTVREEIVDGEPPHHQSYILLSGMPVKTYRADVYFDDRPSGSLITWEATFDSRIPGLGALVRVVARSGIAKTAAALAREAERQAHAKG
jgi:hypothetical protein